MDVLSNRVFKKSDLPSRILQFGQGNFLRAFIGGRIDALNHYTSLNAGITIVRRSEPEAQCDLNKQDGLYTIVSRGLADAQSTKTEQHVQLVSAVNKCLSIQSEFDSFLATARNADYRFVFSNNTEMGIEYDASCQLADRPARSFPAKLTQWLHMRFQTFHAHHDAGVYIIPCELLENNGTILKKIILQHVDQWQLGDRFIQWLEQSCYFYNTLVDQIVTGYPEDAQALAGQMNYIDRHLTATELYSEFVLSGPGHLKAALCLDEYEQYVADGSASPLRLSLVDDITPYAERKVRMLNGSHSAMVPLALHMGLDSVRDAVTHPVMGAFINRLMEQEIMPLLDLPKDDLMAYKQQIIARFMNPTIEHKLLAITLNSITKYRIRLVPLLLRYYQKFTAAPNLLSLAFAGQLLLLCGDVQGEPIELNDNAALLAMVKDEWAKRKTGELDTFGFVSAVFASEVHWGFNLNVFAGWAASVSADLDSLIAHGAEHTLQQTLVGHS